MHTGMVVSRRCEVANMALKMAAYAEMGVAVRRSWASGCWSQRRRSEEDDEQCDAESGTRDLYTVDKKIRAFNWKYADEASLKEDNRCEVESGARSLGTLQKQSCDLIVTWYVVSSTNKRRALIKIGAWRHYLETSKSVWRKERKQWRVWSKSN